MKTQSAYTCTYLLIKDEFNELKNEFRHHIETKWLCIQNFDERETKRLIKRCDRISKDIRSELFESFKKPVTKAQMNRFETKIGFFAESVKALRNEVENL